MASGELPRSPRRASTQCRQLKRTRSPSCASLFFAVAASLFLAAAASATPPPSAPTAVMIVRSRADCSSGWCQTTQGSAVCRLLARKRPTALSHTTTVSLASMPAVLCGSRCRACSPRYGALGACAGQASLFFAAAASLFLAAAASVTPPPSAPTAVMIVRSRADCSSGWCAACGRRCARMDCMSGVLAAAVVSRGLSCSRVLAFCH